MRVKLPDGRIIDNVPEGTTKTELMRRLEAFDSQQTVPEGANPTTRAEVTAGAAPSTLTPTPQRDSRTGIDKAQQVVRDVAPEAIGSTAGGMAGAAAGGMIGAVAGPPGVAIGALIGGVSGAVAGGAAGRQLGQVGELGAESAAQSLKESALGEAEGRVIARVVSPAAGALLRGADRTAQALGLKRKASDALDALLLSGPLGQEIPFDRVIDAQENILGRRMLTVFEESGGRVGAQKTRMVANVLDEQRRRNNTINILQKRNDDIRGRITERLGPQADPAVRAQNAELTRSLMSTEAEKFGEALSGLGAELRNLRRGVKVPLQVEAVNAQLETIAANMAQDVGTLQASRLLRRVEDILVDQGNVRSAVGLDELKDLDEQIKGVIGEFSDRGTQSRLTGSYAEHVKPFLQNIKLGAAKSNKKLANVLEKEAVFAEITARKRALDDLGELVKDGFKGLKTAEDVALFKTAMMDVEPLAVEAMQEAVKADVFQSILNESGVSTAKVSTLLASEAKVAKVTEALGPEYAKALEDAVIVNQAMKQLKGFENQSLVKITEQERLGKQAARTALGSIFSRINLIAGVSDEVTRKLLFKGVRDEQLLKALTGPAGERAVSSNVPLQDPIAYTAYVQLVRSIETGRERLNELSYEEYLDAVDQFQGRVQDAINSGDQQDAEQQ